MKQSTPKHSQHLSKSKNFLELDDSVLKTDQSRLRLLFSSPLSILFIVLVLLLAAYFIFKSLTPSQSLSSSSVLSPQADIVAILPHKEVSLKPTEPEDQSVTLLTANEEGATTPATNDPTSTALDSPLSATNSDSATGNPIVEDTANLPEPSAILNREVPKDNSLIKEEIDRLDDEHSRLVELEELALQNKQQMQDISQKKAAQIELLEQQIAQLEAQK